MTIVTKPRIVKSVGSVAKYVYGVNEKNQTVAIPYAGPVVPQGIDPTSTTDSTAAIQAAIDEVAARFTDDGLVGFDSFGGVVELPPGTFKISDTLTLKRGVKLRGAGRRATMLLVDSAAFPANSRVITLGRLGQNEFAYNSVVEGMSINCAFRADLIAFESDHSAEGAAIRDVLVRGTFRAVRFYREAGLTVPSSPTEVLIENCEFWLEGSGGPAAPRYAIDFDDCEQSNVVRFCSVIALNDNAGAGSASIRVSGCAAEIDHLHSEKIETAVLVTGTASGSCRVQATAIEHYNGAATYGVYIDNSNVFTTVVVDTVFVNNSSTAYAIMNTVSGDEISSATGTSRIGRYNYQGSSSSSLARYNTAFFGNADSTNPLALDYYRENTFTPAVTFGGAATGVTYALQKGTYTRVGNRVFFDLRVDLSSKGSATGDLKISGLPFTALDSDMSYPAAVRVSNTTADWAGSHVVADVLGNDTGMRLIWMDTSSGTDIQRSVTDADVTNTTIIAVVGHYRCA